MLFSDPFFPLVTQLQRPAAFVPLADVTVSDSDMVLTMDIPGVRAEDLDVEFLDGYLVVRGVRQRPDLPEGTTWSHVERAFGQFERRIRVPEGIDADRIMASVDNGVLSLIVPKPERLKPRTIPIAAGTVTEQRELETATA
jgi:HSP20 family protein